ncbi:MAG: acetyl-CoA carboxylase biotin carboxyl carrier protein [Bradyrhizobium sp.]|nr:MAG: acetyl-CoA carboxylase biotin carboxyl carrier protein [Bradyrhizobium sp.]
MIAFRARRQHVPAKKPTEKPAAEPKAGGFDLSVISELAKIAAANDLSEVEVERAGLRIRVARERQTVVATQITPIATPILATAIQAAPAPVEAAPAPAEHPGTVKSPMVGTAYLRPSPDTKAFVEVGSAVKAGDKLLLVEAMKTFNEIVASRAGKVVQILIEDGSPVEYGQPLMVIE